MLANRAVTDPNDATRTQLLDVLAKVELLLPIDLMHGPDQAATHIGVKGLRLDLQGSRCVNGLKVVRHPALEFALGEVDIVVYIQGHPRAMSINRSRLI